MRFNFQIDGRVIFSDCYPVRGTKVNANSDVLPGRNNKNKK